MASSAGLIALALEGRAAMVTASAVRTYGLTPLPRQSSGANASGASRLHSSGISIGNGEKERSCPRAHGRAHRAAAHSTVGRVQHLIHRTRWLARRRHATALREGV